PAPVQPKVQSVGQPIDRVDGRRKVTGTATYADEARPPRLAHAVVVQSTIASGRIVGIDGIDGAARRAPGVLAILTHENAPPLRRPGRDSGGRMGEDRLPLADDAVHYAGQHVAVVVAETLEQAQHAAALVGVRYQESRPVLEVAEAMPS